MNDSCLPAAGVNFSIYAEFGSLQKERVLQPLPSTLLFKNAVTMVTSPTHPSIFRACANN